MKETLPSVLDDGRDQMWVVSPQVEVPDSCMPICRLEVHSWLMDLLAMTTDAIGKSTATEDASFVFKHRQWYVSGISIGLPWRGGHTKSRTARLLIKREVFGQRKGIRDDLRNYQ